MKRLSRSTRIGEEASTRFHIACLTRGFLISKPVLDYGYDIVVHNVETNDMWRVQVKMAAKKTVRLKAGHASTYWTGATHRKRGTRYPPGFVQRFAFAKRDGSGFWIIDGKRFDNKSGLGLTDKDWERWDLFGQRAEDRLALREMLATC